MPVLAQRPAGRGLRTGRLRDLNPPYSGFSDVSDPAYQFYDFAPK
jgi:hypothetical protein